jgi:hypothetical protein
LAASSRHETSTKQRGGKMPPLRQVVLKLVLVRYQHRILLAGKTMGVTIHYRGTMDDVALVEEMEDRVIDLALALGGRATV